jgi:hypothetical protein
MGYIWGFALATTHPAGQVSSVEAIDAFKDAPDDWHHYAFIWKNDGLDFPEIQDKKFGFNHFELPGTVILLTVDGKPIASAGKTLDSEDWNYLRNTASPCRLFFYDDKHPGRPHPKAISDLKIWDHAKLPVVTGE